MKFNMHADSPRSFDWDVYNRITNDICPQIAGLLDRVGNCSRLINSYHCYIHMLANKTCLTYGRNLRYIFTVVGFYSSTYISTILKKNYLILLDH